MQVHLPANLYVELVILIFIAAILKLISPKLLGYLGESGVRKQLETLDKTKYVVLNDIYLRNAQGKTSQIDHIVVSKHGVFVIETKNYAARILGKETDAYWTVLYGRRKEKLKNPFHQNFGHVQTIKEIIGDMMNVPLISMVVFSRSADLKVEVKPGTQLLRTREVVTAIKKFDKEVLTSQQVASIVNQLHSAQVSDKGFKKKHVQDIKSSIARSKASVKNGVCPRCGGQLVKKSGKYSPFTACGNYPKCRFTQPGA